MAPAPVRTSEPAEGTPGAGLRPPPRMRPPPAVVGLVGMGGLLALAYPFALERALAGVATRSVAAAVALLGAASLAVPLGPRGSLAPGRWLRAAVLVLPALAAATGDVLFLLLVPAAIQAVLAGVFALSLRGGGSILQEAARYLNPYAPGFIAPYCRKVTAIFAGILALQGAAVAALALRTAGRPDPGWALLAGVAVWAPLGVASAVEWAVRKSWFRYYTNGPVDRLLRAWLPPENTAAGRRSLEYIRRKRKELGMPPP